MKTLNNMKFIVDTTTTFNEHLAGIDLAMDYNKAKEKASMAVGFVDCMIVYLNAMIDEENNDFTSDLDGILDEWLSKIYQKLADKAVETEQPEGVIQNLFTKRNQYLE